MIRELYYPDGTFMGTMPISFLESRKQQFLDAGKGTLYSNLHEKVNMWSWTKQGAKLYQYGALYVTTSKDTARDFARRSFAGGERGLIVYRMLEGAEFLGISIGHPDGRTAKAIRKIKSFAEADEPKPVIVVLNDLDPRFFLSEEGEPADMQLKMASDTFPDDDIIAEFSFRYLKDVDLSRYPFERV